MSRLFLGTAIYYEKIENIWKCLDILQVFHIADFTCFGINSHKYLSLFQNKLWNKQYHTRYILFLGRTMINLVVYWWSTEMIRYFDTTEKGRHQSEVKLQHVTSFYLLCYKYFYKGNNRQCHAFLFIPSWEFCSSNLVLDSKSGYWIMYVWIFVYFFVLLGTFNRRHTLFCG